MHTTRTTRYDVAEHLRTPEEMAAYLEACLEDSEGDASFVAKALGDIVRARGLGRAARETGLSRSDLHESLSGVQDPSFDVVLKVVHALGLEFRVAPICRSS